MLQIIQYQKTGEITIEDIPDIKCAPGGILVQNHYSLISAGTERTSVETAQASMIGKAKSRPDLVKQVIDNVKRDGLIATYEKVMNRLDNYKELGYSSAGIVLESNAEEFRPGDRVACAGTAYHSELVFIPKNLAVKVPNEIELDHAAFTTLASIALQGVRQSEVKLGENVAVIGLGLVGLITVQLLKANGCKVIGLEINEKNFGLAKELGCDEVIILDHNSSSKVESFTNGYGTDSILIAASTKSNDPVEYALKFARKKSKIVIVGVIGMNIPRAGFYEKELDITISCSYGPGRYDYNYEQKGNDYPIGYVRWTEKRNMEAILQLLGQKRIDFSRLISHKIPIEDGLKAYDLITDKVKEPYLGVLIEYKKEQKSNYKRSIELSRVSNKKNINVGFIGAGNFAQSYLLPNLKHKKINLHYVATRTPINAKSVAKKFDFSNYSCDTDLIINDESIDTIFIASHHSSHAKYVAAALEKGKNVFVEKPLAINEAELNPIIQSFNHSIKKGLPPLLMVGFNRRFSKQFGCIKDFYEEVNEPFIINYRVNAGFIPLSSWIQNPDEGGRIIGEGCHFIDIFDFLIESEPVNIYATTLRRANSNQKDEDNSIITINYKDGSVATLTYLANGDRTLPKEYCEVFAGGATAIMNNFDEVQLFKYGKRKKIKFDGGKGHKEEIQYFINLLLGISKQKLTFDSIYNTTKLTFKAIESIRSNKIVDF